VNQLKVIIKNNLRVLTSAQLAEAFQSDLKQIRQNFNNNKLRYEEGKHYFILQGEDLRGFKTEHEISTELKHSHTIYLWTEKGAFLHAKSLSTDKAWNAYTQLVDDYFKKAEEAKQPQQEVSTLSPLLQVLVQIETRQNAMEAKISMYESDKQRNEERFTGMEEVKEAVTTMTDNILAIPDHTKVVSTVNEFARWTRMGHNEVYNNVYETLKKSHGIDVRQRVENERERIQKEYSAKTGKHYSESTLKSKVNGIDVMVRMGCLDKFNNILVAMLSKEKIKSTLRVVN
jgi:phage regulator Rha-like protein